jgi:hypothetical protein
MSLFDGNGPEMPEHRPVDDGAIEAALAGSTQDADLDALSSFVSTVRSAVGTVPTPSTAMAAVLAAGLSTDKGDLPATAASNVNGPAPQEAGLPKWRKALMKIQGFLAGLGVVGKVALGVGVAAAATTGAGAAGVLPFSIPGVAHAHGHTVVVHTETTTTMARSDRGGTPPAGHRSKHGHTAVHHAELTPTAPKTTTPTTVHEPTTTTVTTVSTPTSDPTPTTAKTPTTGETPTTVTPTTVTSTTVDAPTSTTTAPTTTTTGSSGPTQSIQLSCAYTAATQVTCNWTTAPAGSVAKYALWRWTTGGNGSDYAPIFETTDGSRFVDYHATGGPYTYRVFTTLANGASGPWSNKDYPTSL